MPPFALHLPDNWYAEHLEQTDTTMRQLRQPRWQQLPREFALLTTFGNGESLSHVNVAVQGLALLSISLTMSVLLMVRFIKDKTSTTPKE